MIIIINISIIIILNNHTHHHLHHHHTHLNHHHLTGQEMIALHSELMYTGDEMSKTLSSMLLKCLKPSHLC